MATKISGMTAKTGELDFDELVEIVTTPSTAPATRRVTTGQIGNIENRDLTSLRVLAQDGTGAPNTIAANDDYIFVVNADDYLSKIDRKTGITIQSSQPLGAFTASRAICIDRRYVYLVTSAAVVEINIDDISSYASITATGLYETIFRRNSCAVTKGQIYNINPSTNQLQIAVRGASSYTVTNYTLTGVAGTIEALIIDFTGTYFYVLDDDSGDAYIRKFDVATRTLQTSTALITDSFASVQAIGISGTNVAVSINGKIRIYAQSDLSEIYDDSSVTLSNTNTVGCICGGFLLFADSTPQVTVYQLPSKTLVTPDFVDELNTEKAISTPSVTDTDGNPVQFSQSNLLRSSIITESLELHRLAPGARVISIVDSSDSEITNAVPGQSYLLSNTDEVFFKLQNGVRRIKPHDGDTVFETTRGIYHDYFDGQWVTRVDTVIRGTVTIPSGTAAGTWTSSHVQFNNGNPMMLNDDDIISCKNDYKLMYRYDTSRSILHRSNRVDIAPEYLVNSYSDDVSHGTQIGASAANDYVLIGAETTPDKSGIVFAVIVIEIPSTLGYDMEIEYDIRLRGTLFNDAGTYDC